MCVINKIHLVQFKLEYISITKTLISLKNMQINLTATLKIIPFNSYNNSVITFQKMELKTHKVVNELTPPGSSDQIPIYRNDQLKVYF